MHIQNIGKAQLQRGYYNNDGRAVVIPIRPREPYKELSAATDMAINHDYWNFTVYSLFNSKNKPRDDWQIHRMKLKVLYNLAEDFVDNIRSYRSIKDYKEADKWREKLNKLGFGYDVVKDDYFRL